MSKVLFFFNLQCNYDETSLAKIIPKFYTECLSPHVSESRFQNPRNFRFWNPESWALEPGILLMIGIRNPTKRKWNPTLLGKIIPKFHTECLIEEWKFTNRNLKFLRLCRFLIKWYGITNFLSPHVRESGFQNPRVFRFWNPESCYDCNPESNRKKMDSFPFGNPRFTELESGIQYPESGIHNVESRIQDCHGSSYMGWVLLRSGNLQTKTNFCVFSDSWSNNMA